ncbi:hypothetical protein [Streptomyces sp. NPDC101166]|uniref:hypothetical protein n=1 Tax=Streptomyces sp. NPDC101166 TaxID=3366120 RepID=UPI00381A35CC
MTHHEFEALVRKVLGVQDAESIAWRERIDLVRYRVFEGGLLSLLLVFPSPPERHRALVPGGVGRHRPCLLMRWAAGAARTPGWKRPGRGSVRW